MATMFIKDESYAKAINLHDAAVEATSAICRQLPWQHYVLVLRYFIAYMSRSTENQKLAIRSVARILSRLKQSLDIIYSCCRIITLARPGYNLCKLCKNYIAMTTTIIQVKVYITTELSFLYIFLRLI